MWESHNDIVHAAVVANSPTRIVGLFATTAEACSFASKLGGEDGKSASG